MAETIKLNQMNVTAAVGRLSVLAISVALVIWNVAYAIHLLSARTGTLTIPSPNQQPQDFEDLRDITLLFLMWWIIQRISKIEKIEKIENNRQSNDESHTLVELGAGDYKNAIANKARYSSSVMYATNYHDSQTAELIAAYRNIVNAGSNMYTDIINGFNAAKALGINVGVNPESPLTNSLVPINIADIVYVIAPFPGLFPQERDVFTGFGMGKDAGFISKENSGSEIYVSADGNQVINEFKQGVISSGHICNWSPAQIDRFGLSSYTNITVAETCITP